MPCKKSEHSSIVASVSLDTLRLVQFQGRHFLEWPFPASAFGAPLPVLVYISRQPSVHLLKNNKC